MTMAVVWSPLRVGSMASAREPEHCQARTHRSRGAKQRANVQLGLAGAGPVAAVVEPLANVLAEAVPVAAAGGEGGGYSVLTGAAGQDRPVHPEHQASQLWLREVR